MKQKTPQACLPRRSISTPSAWAISYLLRAKCHTTRTEGSWDDDAYAQAIQCLSNLSSVLAVHGFSKSDVRQLVVYVVGEQANLSAAWKAVAESFDGSVPPATLLGVARLGYVGQLVEVAATVLKA